MTLRTISDIFKAVANDIDEVKSYNFGWASDRTRSTNTEDFQELNEYPRVFFAVPTVPASNQIRKQDTYQVTIFVDDLLGYDNEGDADLTLQIDKWSDLQVIATKFIQRLNALKQTLLPDYIYIPEPPQMTFDSFVSMQRLVTVQVNFNIVVPTNCDTEIQRQVLVFANLLGEATLQAGININVKVSSQMTGSASLEANLQLTKLASAALSASASISASALVSKLAASSLTGAGTLVADLTVTAAASLLLDLYPNAAAAYSLRKLRTAYTGSAIRVRRSSDNTEQNIGFDVNGNLDTTALTTFVGAGNGFVTIWYDQSLNGNNATQTTQANQPQIVSSGNLIVRFGKPYIEATSTRFLNLTAILVNNSNYSFWMTYEKDANVNNAVLLNTSSSYLWLENRMEQYVSNLDFITISNLFQINTMYLNNINVNYLVGANQYRNNILLGTRGALTSGGGFSKLPSNFYRNSKVTFNELVFYSFNQDINRIEITNNINTYYGIY